MNSKKAGISFLLLVVLQLLIGLGISLYYVFGGTGDIPIAANLILAQIMNMAPVFLVILIGRRRGGGEKIFADVLGFRPVRLSTAFMTILFTVLIMPLSTLANAISMLFVDNAVESIMGDVLDVPFAVMFFLVAVFAPFGEELVFRGAFFRGFRKSGNIFGAVMLSALLFALMHLNFNQAAYAVLLGIMMALAAEATGSTVTSFIIHLLFNGQSVCLMYLSDRLVPEILGGDMEIAYGGQEWLFVIAVYLFLAVVCTAIAFCVLTWMAAREGKQNFLRTVWASRKAGQEKLWSVWLIIGILLALIYMIAAEIFM